MITQVMDFCQNHFLKSAEDLKLTFAAVDSVYTISGEFNETYLVGQYVYIKGSILNDGAYKITAVSENQLTVENEVLAEVADSAYIFGCAVPRSFISLVDDITTWVASNGNQEGVASEGIDDYSVAYSPEAQKSGWQGAFQGRLAEFRAIFNDIDRYLRYGL